MSFDAKLLKEVRTPPQSMFRKDGIPKPRLHETFDPLGVLRLHFDVRLHSNFPEKSVNHAPHIASFRIKQERRIGHFSRPHRADMTAGGFLCRRTNKKQLFIEQGNDLKIVLGNRQRNQRQVETPIVKSRHHFFCHAHRHAYLRIRKPRAQLPERPTELVNERSNPGREVERPPVLGYVVFELLLDVPHQLDDFFAAFRQAPRGGRRNQPLSPPPKKCGVEFLGKVVKLEAHGARRQMNSFRRSRHAGRVHYREKQLKLMDIHCILRETPTPCERQSQPCRSLGSARKSVLLSYCFSDSAISFRYT